MISAVICVTLGKVSHLSSVTCHVSMYCLGSFLLQNMLFRYALKSSRICFKGQNMKFTMNILLTALAFEFCFVTPGPAIIRTVCKYSSLIFITDKIFAFGRFSLEMP